MVWTSPAVVPLRPDGKVLPLREIPVALEAVYLIVVISVFWFTVWLALPPERVIVGAVFIVTDTDAELLSQPLAEVVTA
jgi:hypothetical protein